MVVSANSLQSERKGEIASRARLRGVRAVALAVVLIAAAACGRNEAEGQSTPSGSAPDTSVDEQQARFDRERNPQDVVKAAGIHDGSRVADIGAGTGLLTVHLARAVRPNGHVVATDIDAEVFDRM